MANSDAGIAAPSMMNSRVEDLVAAVLGIRLREHHQLDIGGIAPELRRKRLHQIVDLLVGEREAPARHWRAPAPHGHPRQDRRLRSGRGAARGTDPRDPACRARAIRSCGRAAARRDRAAPHRRAAAEAVDEIQRSALQAPHDLEPAHVGDVGGLARPGDTVPSARRHQQPLVRAPPAVARAARRSTICPSSSSWASSSGCARSRRNESDGRISPNARVSSPAATAAAYRAGIATARARRAN